MDERDRRKQARDRESNERSDKYTANGKLRKKYTKRLVLDANTTTSQSVLSTGASVKGSSKKINYDALKVKTFPRIDCSFLVSFRVSSEETEASLRQSPSRRLP